MTIMYLKSMEIYIGTDCSKNTRKVEVLGMISDDFWSF